MPSDKSVRGGLRVDLHVHTLYSGDNDSEPEDMAEAAIRRGLHGLAFTEHDSYEASEFAIGLAEKYSARLAVFRGVEISALEGHCLVFGLDTDGLGLSGAPVAEVARAVSMHGGVLIPAHPYRRGSGIGELVRHVDGIAAIEGRNGCNMHPMNEAAVRVALDRGLPCTGGSDAHMPAEVGACYTLFEIESLREGIASALSAGNYTGVDTRKVSAMSWLKYLLKQRPALGMRSISLNRLRAFVPSTWRSGGQGRPA